MINLSNLLLLSKVKRWFTAWLLCWVGSTMSLSVAQELNLSEKDKRPSDGPLSSEQILAIKQISFVAIGAHHSQQEDSETVDELKMLAKDLDAQIETESLSESGAGVAAEKRADRRRKSKNWIEKLRLRRDVLNSLSSEPPLKRKLSVRRSDLFQKWAGELNVLTGDAPVTDRVARLRALRESIELRRHKHVDDPSVSPTMTVTSPSAGR